MGDIATWIVEAGRLLGYPSELHDRGCRPNDGSSINLVVAPHEFYLLGDFTDRQIDDAARLSVPVCTEQPGTPWFEISRLFCRASKLVIDINLHGVEALRSHGIDAHHLRLGGVPSIDRRIAGATRTTELLFLGGRTDRRSERLAEMAPLLWDRAVDLRMFSFNRPVSAGVGGLVFGAAKYDLLADSRVLLNLHRDDARPGYFEWARMIEAMANGCCVVTEPSAGYEPLEPGRHFIETDDPAAVIRSLLDDPAATAAVARRAAEAVLDRFPLTATLQPLLERIDRLAPARPRRRLIAPQLRRHSAARPTGPRAARLHAHGRAAATCVPGVDGRDAPATRHRAGPLSTPPRHGRSCRTGRVRRLRPHSAPEVSVVVTLYDYAHLVTETLDSIAASTEVEFEIVVVDDHSHDEGRTVVTDWIGEHPHVAAILLGSDINRGLPAARNLGFEAARAAKVMVMDADNMVYPTALRRLADRLDADPRAAFAYSALEEFGTSTGVRSAMAWHVPWLCEANYIDAQAMLRRDAWQRHGGYRTDDELVFGWEDWELWLRFAAAGEHGVYVAQMLGRYRTQQVSMLSTTNLVADHMLAHLRELYPELPWSVSP